MLDLLERYRSAAELAATSEKTLANRPTKLAPRMGTSLAAEIVQALSEQAVIVPGTQAATIGMPRLAQQFAPLRKQRDKVASEVERLVHAPPLWPVLTSMLGVGVRTAARLLTEVAHKAFEKVKTNPILARKALAHKLARACFHMLKEHKPFDMTCCFE